MHLLDEYAYGLWGSVIFNILLFGIFTLTAFKPATKKDWRTLGAFTAFMAALFSEMFGFPLTIYFLTSILGNKYPVLDPFTHLNGHLWVALSGGSTVVYSILHPLSNTIIFGGIFVIAIGMYAKLAKKEEKAMIEQFGEGYMEYSKQVPAFIPAIGAKYMVR